MRLVRENGVPKSLSFWGGKEVRAAEQGRIETGF